MCKSRAVHVLGLWSVDIFFCLELTILYTLLYCIHIFDSEAS